MTRADLVHLYSKRARPLMLPWMPPNSCIGAARLTVLFFESCGIQAVAEPVKLWVEHPAKKLAYASGLTEADLDGKKPSANFYGDKGWAGHLIVRVGDTWLIDPSFDQVFTPVEATRSTQMLVIGGTGGDPLPPVGSLSIDAELAMDVGERLNVKYRPLEDRSYLQQDAWNDEALPFLADHIMVKLLTP